METEGEAGIYARESAYLECYVQIGIAGGRLLSVSFPDGPPADAQTEQPLLDRIEAYLEGTTDAFDDVEVAMTMPTDHQKVLEAVRDVPYGESASVEDVTRMAGLDPEDSEDQTLVRTALAENPTPLVIGDHRIRDGPSAAPPGIEQRLRSLEGL
ncbi:MAG: MGMT family protein [Natronomonas sp.]